MPIKDLYKKNIARDLNPAVSAEDLTARTIETEIDEYVFTDDIINGLYSVLSAIMEHHVNHNGIWINGFFGSGKSHFLKYIGYCVNPHYREKALYRLEEAVRERDPLQNEGSKSDVTIGDFNRLAAWIRQATVDIVLFNIGAVYDTNADRREVFTQVFWHQFNKFRGYNSENLALAQHLEKVLDRNGRFDAFKQRLKEEGFEWSGQAGILSVAYLDHLLEIAKELVPGITTDAIKNAIKADSENVAPDVFCRELKEYVTAKQNPHYRLLFLVDEVSQFIGDNKQLLLQLQEIVTGLCNTCGDKVWLACTAQQDLSMLMTNMQILETNDDYGRIMGRFEVRVSLKGSQTEYITQKRLLDKNEAGQVVLHDLYEKKRLAIDNQFKLPFSFNAYKNEADFINYYPFVPYQFRLMMLVLDSFGALGYIDVQSRGNERSVIKITHSTAQSNMNDPVGNFIAFDRFYNSMFAGSLRNTGQRAIANAEEMIDEYKGDKAFARRVVNVLFMVCNLKESDKLLFPATLDNIVTLLMEDVDANRQTLVTAVERTLAFLRGQRIIRLEKDAETGESLYCFQSADEIEAEREIAAIQVDNAMMAERYREIFAGHFRATSNRERYCSRDFSVGWTIYGRNSLANNPDVLVEFAFAGPSSGGLFDGAIDPKKLTFNIWAELANERELQNDFYYYCQVQQFVSRPSNSATRARTVSSINDRVKQLYTSSIVPRFNAILNRCRVKSGNTDITVNGEGASKYHNALAIHLGNLYEYATLAVGATVPTTPQELQQAILRPVEPGDYGELNPMTPAEGLVEQYIGQQIGTVYVSEVFRNFADRPYGWSNVATAYFLNELRRRQKRAFTYNNDTTVDNATIAQNLITRSQLFTVTQATVISRERINEFIGVWRNIFNTRQVAVSYDSGELFRLCKETRDGEHHVSIDSTIRSLESMKKELSGLPLYDALDGQIELLKKWKEERDHLRFFEMVKDDEATAKELFDKGKAIRQFIDDMLPAYKEIRQFAKENEYNFQFLPDKSMVAVLMPIINDAWPIPTMRNYARAKSALSKDLEKLTEAMREEIKMRYAEVFEDLRGVAVAQGVSYTINEEKVLAEKTASTNLYVLKNALDVTDYRASQVSEMMSRRPVVNDTDTGHTEPPHRRVRMITLRTGSNAPLNTEAAVDAYLAQLKLQLMEKVASREENEDIMVK